MIMSINALEHSSTRSLEEDSSGLRVIEMNPRTDPRWEAFVESHPDGTIYHHPAWLDALQREYGQRGIHLACESAEGNLLAILPLLYTRGLPFWLGGGLTRRRLSSLPRTPVAGPLSRDRLATIAVIQAAVERIRQDRGVQLQIKTQGTELDGLVEGIGCAPWRLSYLLRLPKNSGRPFRIPDAQHRAKIRWAVNKATKLGVVVRPAETEAELRAWYLLYLETMRRNVVPPRPYRFFETLWGRMRPGGMIQLLLACKQEAGRTAIVAGSIFFMFGRTVSYAFNGSCQRDLPLRPNDVIQWQAINDAIGKGFESFDFGEVPEGHEALAKFKSKWGSEPTRLYRYHGPGLEIGRQPETNSNGYATRLTEAVWQGLPLSVTAWLGDRLYSRL